MKIKKHFFILSSLIILIPIFCSVFIIIHTYIHSPNRYLIKGSSKLINSELSADDSKNLKTRLEMLPQEVEAAVFRTTDRKIIYSTIQDIIVGETMQQNEIWNLASKTSDKYFYQFSRIPSKDTHILLLTRTPLKGVNHEEQTRIYLKVLFVIIIITTIMLIIVSIISKTIFDGIKKIETSSLSLSEGNLGQSIKYNTQSPAYNEFEAIMNNLEKMRCELLETQNSKNRFITGISHDLRTPVAVIKGYSEAIMDGVITGEAEIHNSMDLIGHKATQLEEMIDTLINFMKFNNTEIKEKLVTQSITQLIRNFAKYAEITGKVFKRNVTTDIQISKDIKVPLNDQLVHRSFENLLSNALRYTNEDDLIEIIAYQVESESKNYIVLQIKDHGCGIEEKDLDYIFDLFYRGTNSRQEEGMGIGLAVVKSIMESHGWDISVESKKNKGSCFTIKIPYQQN